MKKALLITYYWPPAGGAGVHRWLRMSKYFAENNVELTVYCPENPAYPILDEELLAEVSSDLKIIKHKIIEPNQYLKSKSGGSGFTHKEKKTFITKALIWVRGNIFIPDARMLWVRPSTRFLRKYLKANPEITTIITTGPPHSLHLIGRNLKRKLNLHWITDFRDPWSGIDFAEDLNSNERAIRKNKNLEYSVLTEADHVVTISTGVAEELTELGKRKIEVVTNGFEFDLNFDSELTKKFTISHFGSLPNSRNPELLWKVLAELTTSNKEFSDALQVDLYGFVDNSITTSVDIHGLKTFVHLKGNLSHKESILMQRCTQMLLLIVNNQGNMGGTLTGKFFEYLNSKRPILAIGPEDGDLNQAIISTESGRLFNYTDSLELKKYLLASFEQYKTNSLHAERKNLIQFETKNHVSNFIKFVE